MRLPPIAIKRVGGYGATHLVEYIDYLGLAEPVLDKEDRPSPRLLEGLISGVEFEVKFTHFPPLSPQFCAAYNAERAKTGTHYKSLGRSGCSRACLPGGYSRS